MNPQPPKSNTEGSATQPGLFVMWKNSRRQEERILDDLKGLFEILSIQEVHWTPSLFERNYERFYSDLDLRGVYHVFNKGAGPFLAIRVIDRSPVHEMRETSRGPRMVNGRFLDAKLRYRDWLGGIGVHCGETAYETIRDLRMLLGVDACETPDADLRRNGTPAVLHRDVTGARGWESEREAIAALNVGVKYVVIGSPPSPDGTPLTGGARPAQILTDDYHALFTVLNARPVLGFPPPVGGSFRISVAGRSFVVGLRVVGDGYIDPEWAKQCLAGRTLSTDGVYRPGGADAFATYCYRALALSPGLTGDDKTQLAALARELGLAGWSPAELDDPRIVRERLDGMMRTRGFSFVRPGDPTVYVNVREFGSGWPPAGRAAGASRRLVHTLLHAPAGFAKMRYLRLRDWMLRRAPWVKRVMAVLRGLRR